MVSWIGGGKQKSRSSRRQLPITGFAHKAAVVGDASVAAVPATGEAIKIKASKKVAFRPAKTFKKAV